MLLISQQLINNEELFFFTGIMWSICTFPAECLKYLLLSARYSSNMKYNLSLAKKNNLIDPQTIILL